MSILVTRPEPDNRATAEKLRALGYEALLAPLLRFEAVPAELDGEFAGVIITSANALRAAAIPRRLRALPLFAVGDHTAAAARDAGFRDARSAHGDASDLVAVVKAAKISPLLYLAGENVSADLPARLAEFGIVAVAKTVYRMAPAQTLPDDAKKALAGGTVAAVLHYSLQSAKAFVAVARAAGIEGSALALPQICISDRIAQFLREAGATRLAVAVTADENALLAALERAVPAA